MTSEPSLVTSKTTLPDGASEALTSQASDVLVTVTESLPVAGSLDVHEADAADDAEQGEERGDERMGAFQDAACAGADVAAAAAGCGPDGEENRVITGTT